MVCTDGCTAHYTPRRAMSQLACVLCVACVQSSYPRSQVGWRDLYCIYWEFWGTVINYIRSNVMANSSCIQLDSARLPLNLASLSRCAF
jgi:hypothetical protein